MCHITHWSYIFLLHLLKKKWFLNSIQITSSEKKMWVPRQSEPSCYNPLVSWVNIWTSILKVTQQVCMEGSTLQSSSHGSSIPQMVQEEAWHIVTKIGKANWLEQLRAFDPVAQAEAGCFWKKWAALERNAGQKAPPSCFGAVDENGITDPGGIGWGRVWGTQKIMEESCRLPQMRKERSAAAEPRCSFEGPGLKPAGCFWPRENENSMMASISGKARVWGASLG